VGWYHVISRIAGQRFLMDAEEKDVFLRQLSSVAAFSGVDVMTFALMDNHFHLLVRVPKAREVDDAELVERMRTLYGDEKTERILHDWEVWDDKGLSFKVQDAKAALRCRMYDLSQFCKTLKETYTMSYNHRHGHSGTIWGSRFKSVLLSPDYRTLMTVGAYIDLNPVRAGVVENPADYRWSGYGTAMYGNMLSRKSLCSLLAAAHARQDLSWAVAAEAYRSALEGWVERLPPETVESPSDVSRKPCDRPHQTFDQEKVESTLASGARLSLFETLRCRVRHFSCGLALGPAAFVRAMAGWAQRRGDAVRKWECCDDLPLYTATWLRGGDKIGPPKDRVA